MGEEFGRLHFPSSSLKRWHYPQIRDGLGKRTSPRERFCRWRAPAQGKELAPGPLPAGALQAGTPWSAENAPTLLPSPALSRPGRFLALC